MIWTGYDDTTLKQMRQQGHTYGVIADRMRRTEVSCRVRAQRLGLAAKMPRPPVLVPTGDGEEGCKWPSWGHDERPTHVYCGAERPGLGPYCAAHERKSLA